jgi:16S rRNA C967 or C1407 C5-methylase (RsmB/RsmF family)
VPPLFLDVQPGALVLDMCAAPGSKTVQLLEAVSTGGNTDGLVVANDVNRDRAYLLSHQCKRVSSPCLCVTWCAAQVSLPVLVLLHSYHTHYCALVIAALNYVNV